MKTRSVILCALLCGLFAAVGGGVYWTQHRRPSTTLDAGVSPVDLGAIQLRLLRGTTVDAGLVPASQPVDFRLPFVNVGTTPIDLSCFRLSKACCPSGTLVPLSGEVAPGKTGELRFSLSSGERPGHSSFRATVEYLPPGPLAPEAVLPELTIELAFENSSLGMANWGIREIDLGAIPLAESVEQAADFSLQVRDVSEPKLTLRCEHDDVLTACVESTSVAMGVYGLPVTSYRIKIQAAPQSFGLGDHRSQVIAETPLGERSLSVRWKAVPEFYFQPDNCVLVSAPDVVLRQVIELRTASTKPFRIQKVSCDAPQVMVSVDDITEFRKAIRFQVPGGLGRHAGTIRVEILDHAGVSREETLPCTVTQLVAEPTPAGVE